MNQNQDKNGRSNFPVSRAETMPKVGCVLFLMGIWQIWYICAIPWIFILSVAIMSTFVISYFWIVSYNKSLRFFLTETEMFSYQIILFQNYVNCLHPGNCIILSHFLCGGRLSNSHYETMQRQGRPKQIWGVGLQRRKYLPFFEIALMERKVIYTERYHNEAS